MTRRVRRRLSVGRFNGGRGRSWAGSSGGGGWG